MEYFFNKKDFLNVSKEKEDVFIENDKVLRDYVSEIKENCSILNLKVDDYSNLPLIKKDQNLPPFENLSNVLNEVTDLYDNKKRTALKKIATNYILISRILDNKNLRNIGLNLIDKLYL